MERWDLNGVDWRPHHPEILSSGADGRAIVLDLPAGETLQDHQVHEAAWIMLIYGEARIIAHAGQSLDAKPGILLQFAPQERHEVTALSDTRMLLLLTPWPGPGHPGSMTLEEKADVRGRAADRAQ